MDVLSDFYEFSFPAKTTEREKVLIAGGGPARMQPAITAAERGHNVILWEKTDSLGGALKSAKFLSFKKDLNRFKEYQVRKLGSLAVKVLLNTEVTPELAEMERPDVLIAAIGDCLTPKMVLQAVRTGYDAAMAIEALS